MDNISVVTVLTLSGLNHTIEHRLALFCVSLLYYFIILLVNVVVIVSIITDKSLHEPMYIFLCNLCINGLYGTAGFYPKFLFDLLSPHVISYAGCLFQGFVIHSSLAFELSILTLMAYDRFLAICRPLSYHSIMTKNRMSVLIFLSWFLPHYCLFMNTMTILGSRLCGTHINKLYCINLLVHMLSCSRSNLFAVSAYFNYSFYFSHFLVTFWSYMCLIKACATSIESRAKFMQTCLPNLVSLINLVYSFLLDLLYMRFGASIKSQDLKNFMSIQYLIIPPLVNPVIYGFKLTKVRKRIKFCLQQMMGKIVRQGLATE